jgi:hypothetical protein
LPSSSPMLKISTFSVIIATLLLAVAVEIVSAIEWAAYPFFPDKGLVFARTIATILSDTSDLATIHVDCKIGYII